MPGFSAFAKDDAGPEIFHICSVYPGAEDVGAVCGFLGMTPKGRDERPGGNLGMPVCRDDNSCCHGEVGSV